MSVFVDLSPGIHSFEDLEKKNPSQIENVVILSFEMGLFSGGKSQSSIWNQHIERDKDLSVFRRGNHAERSQHAFRRGDATSR